MLFGSHNLNLFKSQHTFPLTAGSRRVWGRPSFSEMFIALFARKYRKYYSKIVFLPKLLINRNSVASPDRTPRPPKLQLPFEQKKNDAGEWAYDHRIGLCVTLIAYLVLAIAFMVGKIVVGAKPSVQGIIIDTRRRRCVLNRRYGLANRRRKAAIGGMCATSIPTRMRSRSGRVTTVARCPRR